ncbi:MAG: hypothetical protein Q7T20_05380 [Saprospiraceae bacterium]|nr:hypothetical protein [Saprospiraceae bacterium]
MRKRFLFPIVSLAFAGVTIYLGYFVQRSDFQTFITAYAAFFGLYVWVAFYQQKHFSPVQTRAMLWLGIGLRVLLLFSIPNLSDDYARFLWDGHLTVAGIHPFSHTPAYFIDNQFFPPGITPELFAKLNSPGYYTVYPPVCQAVFALAIWLFPTSVLGGVFVIKLILLACEMGTIWILKQQTAPLQPITRNFSIKTTFFGGKGGVGAVRCSLLYALNPLVILEITGNCHFEGAMIFFLLAGMVAMHQGKIIKGALWWALATASKLMPVLFLPILWRWLGWRKGLVFNAVFGIACLVLFAPILVVLPNLLASLDLYFRKFQFNASVYYLVREIGLKITGWDIGALSGPLLGGVTLLGVLLIAWQTRRFSKSEFSNPEQNGTKLSGNLATALLFALFLYLSLSATVQPWYLTIPLVLSFLTPWRFMVLWSGLAALSYSHYMDGGMQENYGWIGLEYGLLWGFFFWELWRINVQRAPLISS